MSTTVAGPITHLLHWYACELRRVVDGDTVDLDIDQGFHQWARNIRVRLLGINCPEMRTPEGPAAKSATEKWFGWGGFLLINTVPDTHNVTDRADSFGRYLVSVYRDGDPESLNAWLLRTGMAVPFTG